MEECWNDACCFVASLVRSWHDAALPSDPRNNSTLAWGKKSHAVT
jgi:hypothetical protein